MAIVYACRIAWPQVVAGSSPGLGPEFDSGIAARSSLRPLARDARSRDAGRTQRHHPSICTFGGRRVSIGRGAFINYGCFFDNCDEDSHR
jgi:hypothetical protein